MSELSFKEESAKRSSYSTLHSKDKGSPDSGSAEMFPMMPVSTTQKHSLGKKLQLPASSIATANKLSPTKQRLSFARNRKHLSMRRYDKLYNDPIATHTFLPEPDDDFHKPDDVNDRARYPTWLGIITVFTITLIVCALFALFLVYPISSYLRQYYSNLELKTNANQLPKLHPLPLRPLVDPETPKVALTRTSETSNAKYELVFSDEFNHPGRTFWPGDDPFWEAGNFWYGSTFDYEWYTPEAINTTYDPATDSGVLQITLEEEIEHGQFFRSGMLQSWNKFCFQGGYIETSVVFPGDATSQGYWPGFWLLGNLGRPGYPATNDGMWPYVYEGCDVGIMPNQTTKDGKGPPAALTGSTGGKQISVLPGMRLPSCTCPGEDHPGPSHQVARMAPELDIMEVTVDPQLGGSFASQSFQVAPFDNKYNWDEDDSSYKVYNDDESISHKNGWKGGHFQEALSALSRVPTTAFENEKKPEFTKIGVEYVPDFDNKGQGYITWYINGTRTWTLFPAALNANGPTGIGKRIFPKEPMSIILNLGIAGGFQDVRTFSHLRCTSYTRF